MEYPIRDFYPLVKTAIEQGQVKQFLSSWSGDPNLILSVDDTPVVFDVFAFHNQGPNCYYYIHQLSGRMHREIPFVASIDDVFRVNAVIMGDIGEFGVCDWDAGELLALSSSFASQALGHTHPRTYGALCSDIYWKKSQLAAMGAQELLASGLWKHFGGDYSEIFLRSQKPGFSDISFIGSPREGYLGVFRVLPEGCIEYHPWTIDY